MRTPKPNMQGIPIRTEEGKQLRRALKTSLMAIDYGRVELRVLAELFKDVQMINPRLKELVDKPGSLTEEERVEFYILLGKELGKLNERLDNLAKKFNDHHR